MAMVDATSELLPPRYVEYRREEPSAESFVKKPLNDPNKEAWYGFTTGKLLDEVVPVT